MTAIRRYLARRAERRALRADILYTARCIIETLDGRAHRPGAADSDAIDLAFFLLPLGDRPVRPW